jgi:hypothetical protein
MTSGFRRLELNVAVERLERPQLLNGLARAIGCLSGRFSAKKLAF